MSIIFNEDTAQFRNDLQYYDQIAVAQQGLGLSANETARTTNSFFYAITAPPDSFTLTQDIILTCISLSGSLGAVGGVSINAEINGELVASLSINIGQGQKVIPLPNWFLPTGTILSFSIGGGGNVQGEFIGYLA